MRGILMNCRILAAAIGFLLILGTAGASADSGPRNTETNWYTHGGTHDENNFTALTQINADNVSRLGLAWSLDLPGAVTLEATPLAIDGTLYFSGSYSDVYAVDAATGRLLWRHDPQVWKYRPEHLKLLWGINRGVAYSNGRVFVGTLDGRLQALDAKSGRLLWSVKTVADDSKRTISGAPWVVKGKVLIGHGGADFGARGYVTAYDELTGKQRWRFYTVPGDPAKGYEVDPAERDVMKMAAATWGKDWWKVGGGGGTVWDNMNYDAELNHIYIGVGNAYPYNPRLRSPGGGDNLFLCSIVALDADTGKYIWHYQTNPSESWDFKSTSNMITATVQIDGEPRKVLMQSPSNGFFYVIDRETGKLISAAKTGKVTWADRIDIATGRPVETENIRYENGPVEIWPSPFGTHNWQGMAHDPGRGIVFIPYMQMGARLTDDKTPVVDPVDPAFHMAGVYVQLLIRDPEDGKGALLAWDPVRQVQRWRVQHPSYWNGGPLATAGGLVFQGTAEGPLKAYDSLTGVERWQFDAKLGIIATPISYTVGGKQQISVLVGPGGSIAPVSHLSNRGFKYGAQPRRLLTFALDGKAQLPPTAPPDFVVHAVDDPTLAIDTAQAERGAGIYQDNCAYCHGRLLVSPGSPAPDLRESQLALHWDSFRVTVKEGLLLAKLMPKFSELSDDQVRAVYMYIRAGARDVLAKQQAPRADDSHSTR
jgi:quinohemoprotein ethanol dehydrogenase